MTSNALFIDAVPQDATLFLKYSCDNFTHFKNFFIGFAYLRIFALLSFVFFIIRDLEFD